MNEPASAILVKEILPTDHVEFFLDHGKEILLCLVRCDIDGLAWF